jgi:hypothetical protein
LQVLRLKIGKGIRGEKCSFQQSVDKGKISKQKTIAHIYKLKNTGNGSSKKILNEKGNEINVFIFFRVFYIRYKQDKSYCLHMKRIKKKK